jgi:surface protein
MGSGEVGSGSGSGSGEIVNPGSGSGTFATKADLKAAVELWVSDNAAARSAHGPIADWGVSSITDMSWLFYYSINFNEDISSWDTSSVTDMSGMFQVRRPPRAGSA